MRGQELHRAGEAERRREAGRAPPAPGAVEAEGPHHGQWLRLPPPPALRQPLREPCPPRHPGPAAGLASTRSPGPTEMPQS